MTLTELTKKASFAEIRFSNGIHVALAYIESATLWRVWLVGNTGTMSYFKSEAYAVQYALELEYYGQELPSL